MLDDAAADEAGSPPGRADGFADWLPGDAARRHAVLEAFLESFRTWGFALVDTPLIEPVETVAAGVGAGGQARLFRFMDSDGSLLSLVGERTVSVARVVATQLRAAPLPLRLCYAGPVLRNQPLLGGRRRESLQAGCEVIGAGGLAADAECIALAAAALGQAEMGGVQIDVGHADFIPGLLDGAGLDGGQQHRVLAALAGRDLVAVETALEGTPVGEAERSLLLRFPALRGGRELIGAAAAGLAAPRALAALEQLDELWDLLESHDLAPAVHLDLGAIRDWDYYTGPTFEAFSSDLGFPLGTGGRYDRLLSRLGMQAPATGFVLHVDRCCDALSRRSTAVPPVAARLAYAPGAHADALVCARRLHGAGVRAACDLEPSDDLPAGADLYLASAAEARWRRDGALMSGTPAEGAAALLVLRVADRRAAAVEPVSRDRAVRAAG